MCHNTFCCTKKILDVIILSRFLFYNNESLYYNKCMPNIANCSLCAVLKIARSKIRVCKPILMAIKYIPFQLKPQ